MPDPERAARERARRERLDRVFGDVLPDTTGDERGDGRDDGPDGDERLRREVPPHHGG